MTRRQACKNCRVKKVKCNGAMPVCGTCSTLDSSDTCGYGPTEREKVIKLFRKEACFPCRRKKKRCDAARPVCGKCQVSRTIDDVCAYDDSPGYSPESSKTIQKLEKISLHDVSPGPASPSSSHESEESSKALVLSITPNPSKPDCYRINTTCIFPSTSPSPLQSTIISNPIVSLSDISDPLAFAVSDVSLDDLNMKLRVEFLTQRFIYGVYFPPVKLEAILLGDTSSPFIHPFFIHFAHLVGTQFCQERHGSYFLLAVQARHLVLSWGALKSMKEEDDPLTFAQANFYMGCACTHANSMRVGKHYLKRSMEVIRTNHIRFVSMSTGDTMAHELSIFSPQPESLELIRERVALLAQMVFIELLFYLLGQPSSVLGYDFNKEYQSELINFYCDVFLQQNQPADPSLELEQQFRYELPDAFPDLKCPIVSRVQSTVFAKDASNLIAWFQQQDTPSDSWTSTCCMFLAHLASHIKELYTLILESGDAESRLTFRFGGIISFTTYAQVAFVLSISPSSSAASATKFRNQCSDALRRILELVDGLEPGEFLTLGAYLGVGWSRALSLFGAPEWELPTSSPSRNPSTTYSSPSNTVSSPMSDGGIQSSRHSFEDDSGLEANIASLAELNRKFVSSRYIPGTSSLCTKLAEQNVSIQDP